MSLRKSPELTPALLAAARSNAQHSTGPRSPAAKQKVKLNALKHGAYARDENRHKTMLALGEDPEKLQMLTEELMSAYGPAPRSGGSRSRTSPGSTPAATGWSGCKTASGAAPCRPSTAGNATATNRRWPASPSTPPST